MKKYNEYFRVGIYDLWLSSQGDYRVESNHAGDTIQGIWKGKFSGSESVDGSETQLKLTHRRGKYHFSFTAGPGSNSIVEISIPRLWFGKKVIRGPLGSVKTQNLYRMLSKI